MGGLCDYCVTPVPIGLGFWLWTGLGLALGLGGLDLGLGLDNWAIEQSKDLGFLVNLNMARTWGAFGTRRLGLVLDHMTIANKYFMNLLFYLNTIVWNHCLIQIDNLSEQMCSHRADRRIAILLKYAHFLFWDLTSYSSILLPFNFITWAHHL